VKTYALQVYISPSYTRTSNEKDLGTLFLVYIPSPYVDDLAGMIKVPNSPLQQLNSGVPKELITRIDPAFPITGVQDPNSSQSGGNGKEGAISNQAQARLDVIIGVVSALGAVAFLILGFLVHKSYKRRQELAHRRLSDPPGADVPGLRPEGRDFDQDSVGGQRRRSFYYAEDSLQGYQSQGERQEDDSYEHRSQTNGGMTQRRNLLPATISAPMLQGSTMNW
jgi:hypothetical protein